MPTEFLEMNSPHKPLHVLLVEDSRDDADLILLELSGAGFEVVFIRVDTKDAMRTAMVDRSWDIVISDFNLPKFSARKALSVLRAKDADTPFIIVSGCIGEESAIALMKEGASDFIMKHKLARLVPVIERELQDANVRRERRQAQNALRANEKLLKGIAAALGEGLYVLNDEGKLLFMNPEAERLLGWTESELSGREVHKIIHSQKQDGTPFPESDCGVLGVLKAGGVFKTEEDIFWRKDGSPISVSIVASAIVENGKAVASVVIFQDIGQRKQAERELLESREQLRELTAYLLNVREEERTRIARELHDELGQMLTGVKLDVRWLASGLSDGQPIIVNKIASMSKLIDETLDAMRRVAADLRPVMLDDLGLVAAVEWLTEEFGKRTGLHVNFELDVGQGCNTGCSCDKENCHLNEEVSIAAFRIVQECLTNVARHAKALHIRVLLKCRDDELVLRVSDDGIGMDTSIERKRNSYGTLGMKERVRNLGGTLNISSAEGGGTSVEVVIPITQARSAAFVREAQ
jgi:two-component system sensor histidine kinase UhpB